MTRSKRLAPVVEVAGRREEAAARRLGELNRQLEHCAARLRELLEYREQYRAGFLSAGRDGFGAARLKDYQHFLAKLDAAVAQARAQVEGAQHACERQRLAWLASRTRCLALDKVTARYMAEERKAAERQEQRRTDEHAQQMDARRAREGEAGD